MINSKQSHGLHKQAQGLQRDVVMHHYAIAVQDSQLRYSKRRRRRHRLQRPTHLESSNAPFKFLDLPLDIRLLIYEYLVPQVITPGINFVNMPFHDLPCFAILCVNKQIRSEATKFFYVLPNYTFVLKGPTLYLSSKNCATNKTIEDRVSCPSVRYLRHLTLEIDTSYCVAEEGVTAMREILSRLLPALKHLRSLEVSLILTQTAQSTLDRSASTVAREILCVLNVNRPLRNFQLTIKLQVDGETPGHWRFVSLDGQNVRKCHDDEARKLQLLVRKVKTSLRTGTVALTDHSNNRDSYSWWAAEVNDDNSDMHYEDRAGAYDHDSAEEVEPLEMDHQPEPHEAHEQNVNESEQDYNVEEGHGQEGGYDWRGRYAQQEEYEQEDHQQKSYQQADCDRTNHVRETHGQRTYIQGFQEKIFLSERDGIKLRYAYENPKLCLLQHAALSRPRPGRRPKPQGDVFYRQHIKFDD